MTVKITTKIILESFKIFRIDLTLLLLLGPRHIQPCKYNHQWDNLLIGYVQQCVAITVCVDGKDAHTQ